MFSVDFPFENYIPYTTFGAIYYLMSKLQIELFWLEIAQIQQRNALFFPISQLKYISLNKNDSGHVIIFIEGYNLPDVITLEIQLAFKIISDSDLSQLL